MNHKKISIILLCSYFIIGLMGINVPASSLQKEALLDHSNNNIHQINNILRDIEKKMSTLKTLKTNFIEEKNLAIFDEKILLKGKIFQEKPNLFAWHITDPMSYCLVFKNDTILQWNENNKKTERSSISKNPGFKVIINQMKKWISGEYTSLLEEYEVNILEQNPLALCFTPNKNTPATFIISSVTIRFKEDQRYIHQILINEKSGDNTLFTFIDTILDAPIDKSIWEAKACVR